MSRQRCSGFTLIELLVVMFIIALVSVATLPTILPALAHRQVSESARIVQATIEGARDAAIRANAPRGVRFLADPGFPGSTTATGMPLAYNRMLAIEPGPDYSEGRVSIRGSQADAPNFAGGAALRIEECQRDGMGLPNARTSWYWNIRVGDRIRLATSGRLYTIVGPEVSANAERFVNVGDPGIVPVNPNEAGSEYLFLVNGVDDDQDGYVDEGFDGISNDVDAPTTLVDELDEWEMEAWVGAELSTATTNAPYTIRRRPVPTQGARVVDLPSDVVVDATTWDTTKERSRLPVDANTLAVEIMVSPNGTVIPTTLYSSPASAGVVPFLHIWLSERGDVQSPVATTGVPYTLPMPTGASNYPAAKDASPRFLSGERRLVTINTRSGNIVTNEMEVFDGTDVGAPFYEAQSGIRGAK